MKRIILSAIILLLLIECGYSDSTTQVIPLQEIHFYSDNTIIAESITINEAIAIIEEARDSHILFKWFLENGFAQPTEWTGDIAFQDYVIDRYNKVIALLQKLKKESNQPKFWK